MLIFGIAAWRHCGITRDWSALLEKSVSGVFQRSGLVDDRLVRKTVEEKRAGCAKYIRNGLEYDVPRSFDSESFEGALKASIAKTAFRLTRSDRHSRKGYPVYKYEISRGRFCVLELQVNCRRSRAPAYPQKKEEAAPEAKKKETPPATKTREGPMVAIVIDDFGYTKNNLDAIFDIAQPVTFSILPNQRYSREVADLAASRGYEVILHLPLEAHRNGSGEEAGTIRSGMRNGEVAAQVRTDIEGVPGLVGVSNHTGSKATEDRELMSVILRQLKARRLYFFDSLTSEKSVCSEVARAAGVRCARRDVFLDNSSDTGDIEKQVRELKRVAFSRGKAIAVCHDRKNTVAVLSKMMPEMAEDGIRFVYLSRMVE
jgi:polysaccharide deacetylase 2 family uncharacterized protein YibQ